MDEKEYLLLVDDDQGVLKTMSIWLRREGFAVLTASDRVQALRCQQQKKVVLGVVDLRFKGDDGLQIGAELRARDELLKVIILTGYPSLEGAVDAMRAGVFDYLSKDADNDSILHKIRGALEDRRRQIRDRQQRKGDRVPVVLVGHHTLVREGLEYIFRGNSSYYLQRTFHSCAYIHKNDFSLEVELLLICASCNQAHFADSGRTLRDLQTIFPKAKVLIINSSFDDEQMLRLVRHGARGFLPPNADKETVKKALQTLLNGEMWINRSLANRLLLNLLNERHSGADYVRPAHEFDLSNREIEILQAVASGLSNAEIGGKLFLSEKTVKTHIHHIFRKMGVQTRTQAVLKALESHII